MNRIIEQLRNQPNNEWLVYELCKHMQEELAGLTRRQKFMLLVDKVPFTTNRALVDGLAEFEAVPAHNMPRREQKSTGSERIFTHIKTGR